MSLSSATRKLLPSALLSLGLLQAPGCLSDAPAPLVPPPAPPDMAQPPLDAPVHLSARTIFDSQVLPLILPSCGGCHKVQGGTGPAFMASVSPTNYDPYLITSTWPGFINANPDLSALLTKGQHEGPALTLDQYATVLSWLTQEAAERAATTVKTFNPAVEPFFPVTGGGNTIVPLGPISSQFTGAYIGFRATPITATRGLQLNNVRFYNVRPGAVTGDQRAIHFQRPLFVVWQGTTAMPDPVDSFSSTDLTVPLEIVSGTNQPVGQLITPGILILTNYVPGNALSISFNLMQLVPPAAGSNPCKPAGITIFYNQLRPYLGAAGSCTMGGTACHAASGKAGGIDMSPLAAPALPVTDPKTVALCETLKFYNSVGTILNNTDPNGMYAHPFKWWTTTAGRPNNCSVNGFPDTCFSDFKGVLTSWAAAEQ